MAETHKVVHSQNTESLPARISSYQVAFGALQSASLPTLYFARALPMFTFKRLMRRKTFRQLKARSSAAHHHNVYVVLLAPEAAGLPELAALNPGRDQSKPCVYVGMTGLSPEERFANHKNGIKAAKVVQAYGVRLMPELFAIYNPMPFDAALAMESELAEDLRRAGYTVAGGH